MKFNLFADRILKLKDVNLNQSLDKSEYKAAIKKWKEKIRLFSFYADQVGRPVVLVFEGWDAAGKGGAIRRLTGEIDPRLYQVNGIAAPDSEEKQRHYLWRFWRKIPPKGHFGIFDRSWYGRVLVERVEGFATQEEWSRSFEEIVDFEKQLYQSGAIIIKFWLHISQEEQWKRFEDRKNDPLRRWKFTEEDVRNREKWPLYEEAADEMFEKTDFHFAPWILVPANDKYYARIKVMEEVASRLETILKIPKKFS